MKNQIEIVIDAREKDIGIPVKRILPWAKKRMVGPFIFLDHMGPKILKPPYDHLDVRPHPHIGLSTLTYLFEGSLLHRDSIGSVQVISPGEVNWMTAGSGISHSEREPEILRTHERCAHGLQFWVALPIEHEDVAPSFIHYPIEQIPLVEKENHTVKIIAGEALGFHSPLKAYSPMTFMTVTAKKKGIFSFDKSGHELSLFIVSGTVSIEGVNFHQEQMIVFKMDSMIEVEHSEDALFAVIGGIPFKEPRYIWWNLVSSDKNKIEAAKLAWNDRTFPQVPGEFEWIPAPNI